MWLWLHWRSGRGLQVEPKLRCGLRKRVLKHNNTYAGDASVTQKEWFISVIKSEWDLTFLWFSSSLMDISQSSEDLDPLYEVGLYLNKSSDFFFRLRFDTLPLCCCFLFFFPVVADESGALWTLVFSRLSRTGLPGSGSPSLYCAGRCCRVQSGAVLTRARAFTRGWAGACSRRVCPNSDLSQRTNHFPASYHNCIVVYSSRRMELCTTWLQSVQFNFIDIASCCDLDSQRVLYRKTVSVGEKSF